jgi:hypothetical protein
MRCRCPPENWCGEADGVDQLGDALAIDAADRLTNDVAHPHPWVERTHRILEHDLQL